MEAGHWEAGMLGGNLGEDDWGHGNWSLEGFVLVALIVRDLGADLGSPLGGGDESHDVGVVLEDQNFLVGSAGGIVGGGSDLDDGSSFEMWELDFEGKDVDGGTGKISELELVGVVIKLENLNDLGNNIEIFAGFLAGVAQFDGLSVNLGADINTLEGGVGPVLEGGEDAGVLSLGGNSMATECVWGITGGLAQWGELLGRVESP